jgi:glycosyltransferase involved in cell wall biosynthesis
VLSRNSEISQNLVLIDIDSSGFFEGVALKKLINTGWLNRVEVMDLIRASNAVIVPSSAETFGVLVAEAQLCGTPVLVQDLTACAEVAGTENTSFRFSGVRMDHEVTNFITLLLDRDKIVDETSENGRLWALQKYSPEIFVKEMSRFYQDVIKSYSN